MYFKQQCIFVAVTKSIIQKNSLIIEPHLLLFHRNTNLIPFSGPVLIGGGLMTILFSLEVLYFPHFFKLDAGTIIQAIQKPQIAQLKDQIKIFSRFVFACIVQIREFSTPTWTI